MREQINKLAKGAAFMTIGIIASKILGYCFQIFLARIVLNPAEFGLFLLASSVLSIFVMLSNFGIADSLSRFIAFYSAKKDLQRVKGSILSALKINLVFSVALAIAMFLLSDFLAITFFSKPELGLLLKIFAVSVPISVIGSDFLNAIIGFNKIQYQIIVRRFLQLIVKFGILALFYFMGLSLMAAVLSYIIAEATAFVLGFLFLEKRVFPILSGKIKAIFVDKEMLFFAAPLLLIGVFTELLVMMDVIMLGFFAPAYNTGLYGTAHMTGQLGLMPFEIIVALVVPITTAYFALKKLKEFRKIYSIVSRWIFTIGLPTVLLLIIFSTQIQMFLFGEKYAEKTVFFGQALPVTAVAASILVLGYFLFSVFGPTQQALLAAGKTRLNFYNAIIAGALTIALNLFLIPFFLLQNAAIIGASISTAIAYFVWSALGLIELKILFKIQPFTKIHLKTLFAGIAGICLIAIPASMASSSIIVAIATGIISLGAYALLLFAFKCFEKEDLEIMVAIERKTGIRIGFLRGILKRMLEK